MSKGEWIMAAEGISKSELLDILKSISDPNSFYENEKKVFILPRNLLQGLDTLVKKMSYNKWNLKNELYLSEMSYISDTSVDDINVESP